jgi:exopolyphosphatase / guanosine-5'-triphosphate,3'-diphosphate pyrophosphatase
MEAERRAVIDLGTNSVKLLVAEVDGDVLRPLCEEGDQTRLGEGFYQTRTLQPPAVARTVRAVEQYLTKARSYGIDQPRLIATSAARDAVNRHELQSALQPCGLALEIISGEQEAEWAYQGVCTQPALAGRRLLIVEVGGGSTQFILGQDGHRSFQRSFPLGAVRLLERFWPSDPPLPSELKHCREWLHDFMLEQVKPLLGELRKADHPRPLFLGTGGTAALLARMELSLDTYDREAIEAARLSAATFGKWVLRLWSLPLAERRQIPGLPPPRADVILTGAAIYEAAMAHLGFAEFRVSTRGLRFGALLDFQAKARHGAVVATETSSLRNGAPLPVPPRPAALAADLAASAVESNTDMLRADPANPRPVPQS